MRLFYFLLIMLLLISNIFAENNETSSLANPSAVLCSDIGGDYNLKTGDCSLNYVTCNAWDFFDNNSCSGHILCSSNSDCNSSDYCYKKDYKNKGLCFEKPQICPMYYMPVCGFDGKNYGNVCEANGDGTNVAYFGECIENFDNLTFDNEEYQSANLKLTFVTRKVLGAIHLLNQTNRFKTNEEFQLLICLKKNEIKTADNASYKIYIAYNIYNNWYLQTGKGVDKIRFLDGSYYNYPFLTETSGNFENGCFEVLTSSVPDQVKNHIDINVYGVVFSNDNVSIPEYVGKIDLIIGE